MPSPPWMSACQRSPSASAGMRARLPSLRRRGGDGGGGCSPDRFLDERGHVEQQDGATASELGGARDARHRSQRADERLDHDVLLPEQLVDDEADAMLREADDDDVDALRIDEAP